MEGLALNVITTTSTTTSISPSFRNPIFTRLRIKTLNLSRIKFNANKFAVFASKDDPKFDSLDQMELQFGRLLGEDPQLTMAKIMARKADPDASYLEVEKNFNKNKSKNKNRNKKNKGKTGDVELFPIEWSNAVNLARPVPKKGSEFKVVKPDDVASPGSGSIKRPSPPGAVKRSVPNVNLRKPLVNNPDVEDKSSS